MTIRPEHARKLPLRIAPPSRPARRTLAARTPRAERKRTTRPSRIHHAVRRERARLRGGAGARPPPLLTRGRCPFGTIVDVPRGSARLRRSRSVPPSRAAPNPELTLPPRVDLLSSSEGVPDRARHLLEPHVARGGAVAAGRMRWRADMDFRVEERDWWHLEHLWRQRTASGARRTSNSACWRTHGGFGSDTPRRIAATSRRNRAAQVHLNLSAP